MLGSLKKLFFKDTGEDLATSIPEPVAIAPEPNWSAISGNPAPSPDASGTVAPVASASSEPASGELLPLPLQAILARLPNSLASVVQSQGNGFVSLPVEKILPELPKGSVKIPFGELRRATPPGTFFDNSRLDQVLVELPLADILARLHPSLLSRRPDQKQIQIPAEITNIFGPHGEGISLSSAPVSAPRPAPQKSASTGNTSFAKKGDTSIATRTDTSFRTRNLPPVTPAHIFTSPTAVVPPPQAVANEPEVVQFNEPLVVPLTLLSEGWPELVQVEIRELNLSNARVSLPLNSLAEALRTGKIIFPWKQICAWMQPPTESISGAQDAQVELPLKVVAPLFMAKYRGAKAQKKVAVAEIPDLFAMKPASTSPEAVEPEPAPQPAAPAVKPVAPAITPISPIAFVAPAVATKAPPAPAPIAPVAPPIVPQPKLAMKADNITPLPKPVAVEPVVAPEPKPAFSKANAIGEIFNQPARTNWPPSEVLKHLATLPGIAGAFLAMQDGLLVAAELPSQVKADTVAAFLPQIFGRMNQYTKELQLGGLSSLTFVVENISWQIIKSGGIYLVALSKSGENLPSAKLNTIATELSKQMQ